MRRTQKRGMSQAMTKKDEHPDSLRTESKVFFEDPPTGVDIGPKVAFEDPANTSTYTTTEIQNDTS